MLMVRLLWDPLPDTLSAPRRRRFPWLRDLAAAMTAAGPDVRAGTGKPPRAPGRCPGTRAGSIPGHRRRAGQRAPSAGCLYPGVAYSPGRPLDRDSVELSGWSPIAITGGDTDLAWRLYELASRAWQDAIEHAVAAPSRPVERGQQVPNFEFSIVSDGELARRCHVRDLPIVPRRPAVQVGFPDDWQFCGLGRLALSQLEARHPDLTWYTTGQSRHARGFYDRYRQGSGSPWTVRQHPCPHFD